MSGLIQAVTWFMGALFVAAIATRLLTDKQVPGLVNSGTGAVANIFKGVFRG